MSPNDDTLVLCYHAVSPTWPSPLAVRPEALRTQIASLLAEGFRATTFTEAVLRPAALEPLEQVLVRFAAEALGPRADEIVNCLKRAGFETWLELDPKTGSGYIGARRAGGPS